MSDYSVGQRLGDYEILGVLGAGGMGKVYKVRNTISDRVEAMKILLPDLAGQKELADRFLREIKVLASLSHPHIAGLRTALTLDNQLVMIMEFVDGVTLASRLQQGAIPPALAIKYIDQVLDALSYAHKQNIIHRDIKPANMMLTSDGTVKLMDFGIARSASDRSLTMTGTTLGSLNYMPPEQVKGDPADNRSDLYSLGVSLYELVTGQLPFQADSNYAIMAAHLQEEPRPPIVLRPGIPQPLNQIILMALAKDPNQRFQSADAFRGALKSVATPGDATLEVSPRTFVPSAAAGSGATQLFQQTPAAAAKTTPLPAPMFQAQTPTPQPTQRLAASPEVAEAAPPMPPPAQRGSGHRGLYIALGAFIVVAVLFAAGLYLPRHVKTLADWTGSSKKVPAVNTSTVPSTSSPASAPADASATPATTETPAGNSSAANPSSAGTVSPASSGATPAQSAPASQSSPDASASAPGATSNSTAPASDASSASSVSAPGTAASSAPSTKKSSAKTKRSSAAAGQNPAQLASTDSVPQVPAQDAALAEEVEQQSADVESRTAAVTQSLDNLKRQQAASGYGLRGDIVAAEQRMNLDLSKARLYMQKQDAKSAKKYLDMAEAELQTIEKFLGH